ncbi:TonB-dependent siderophore receptor [Dongia sp.]|uniref:TonB-dependent siderophore receptor n=1 Tax=Dongia sp. TaxID=1977262 RepID=UPI0035B3F366
MQQGGSAARGAARRRAGKFNLNLALIVGGTALVGAGMNGAAARADEMAAGTDWQKRLSQISAGDDLRMDTFVTQVAQAGATADFNIPAQPLDQALIAFSEATGIAVIADATLIADLTSGPVSGTLSPDKALAAMLSGTGLAYRQTADNAVTLERATAGGDGTDLAPLSVEDQAEAPPPLSEGYQPLRVGSNKYTQPLLDTPQTIVVVPEKVLKDRGQSSLRDAIKNVPGVTVASGEGGTRGNTFRIRGFEGSRSDNSVDGLRDNSSSSFRDIYNIEQIEVTKGPSSSTAGRGSVTGGINMVTKTPGLESFYAGSAQVGTDDTRRVTVDVNQVAPEEYAQGVAMRVNGVWHHNEVAERDVTESNRWGIAPSISAGLGTPLEMTLSYEHFQSSSIPDYGLPTKASNNIDDDIDRSNFYHIADVATEDANFDIITGRVKWEADDWLTFNNILRVQWDDFYGIAGHVRTDVAGAAFPLVNVNHNKRTYDNFTVSNQATATAEFNTTEHIEHDLVVGVDYSLEQRTTHTFTGVAAANTDAFDPDPDRDLIGDYSPASTIDYDSDTVAFYAFENMDIARTVELSGGLRYELFDAFQKTHTVSSGATTRYESSDNMLSWKAGINYKPVEYGSIYAAYGTAFSPLAADVAVGSDGSGADPEESVSYEIGTKWNLFDEKLMLSAALFRTDRDGVRQNLGTAADPDYVLLGKQRVEGFEVGLAGDITDEWSVFAGYIYMQDKILEAGPSEASDTATFRNVPRHSMSFWTTYALPWDVDVGAGVTYMSSRRYRFGGQTESRIDDYVLVDAMAAYHLTDEIDIQLNVNNIFNEFYIEQVGNGFQTPGPGRTALLTTSFQF